MSASNPYRPGFAQTPPVLAGRDDITDAISEAFDVAALDGRCPRPILLVGARGVGKTVLLEWARLEAAPARAWLTVTQEVPRAGTFIADTIAGLADARDLYLQQPDRAGRWRTASATVKASAFGVGAEAEFRRDSPDATGHHASLLEALEEVMVAARQLNAGLLLTIDETHAATKGELAQVAAALQRAAAEGWPLVALLAGLPSMQDPRRMVTYLERAEWHQVDLLNEADTRTAVAGPARAAARPMTDQAAQLLADASGGYPYAIQVLGHHTWRASSGHSTITVEHAIRGAAAAQRDLSNGLYTTRWNDASPMERRYLRALAELLAAGQHPRGADVARAMGRQPSEASYLRARLLTKGTVYVHAGRMRLAVPGMTDWILGRDDEAAPGTPL